MTSLFYDRLYNVRRNPALMQSIALSELDGQLNPDASNPAYDVPDGTMPFVFAMECGVMESTMQLNETEALMRKLYPQLAITNEEIYLHMSDDDYIGRFSEPSSTTFMLFLSYDEVIAKAVAYGDQGQSRLVIPRLTEFTSPNLAFTMQYPINLTVMRHGGLVVEYDVTDTSPVQTLSSNIVKWEMQLLNNQKVMVLYIPVNQFQITTHSPEAINPSSLFQTSYTFADQFFYARAYISTTGNDDSWTEVTTTHSALTYDPMNLTVVFNVSNNKLQVSIPSIYMTSGLAKGSLRIDIYTTKGPVDLDMATYTATQFNVTFNAIDDDATYVNPLKTFQICQALAKERVTGGADAVDFNTLRTQVINNTLGDIVTPITNVQLASNMSRRGYTLVSNVDNITNRQFLASRSLDTPTTLDIVSGASVVMSQLQMNMADLAGSTNVADNDTRITILPSMLYQFSNGLVTPLADSEIARLNSSDAETIAQEVNSSRYVYSPFHNVLDASDSNFDFRPYYLDNPTISQMVFIGENDTSTMQATVNTYEIERITNGYRITIEIESGTAFKQLDDDQVVVQIGYQPNGETQYASVNGVLAGINATTLERIYTFDILTNYDINSDNELRTTNMSMFSVQQNIFSAPLSVDFDVTILIVNSNAPGYQANDLDTLVQTHLLPAMFMVVSRTSLETLLGYDMTSMWRRSRTVLSDESYQKWEYDVLAFWTETIFETDAQGNPIISMNPDGTIDYHVIHAKGDPVLGDDGTQAIQYQKGSIKLDAQGNPVLVAPRQIEREVTMFMVDGLFYFATETDAAAYAKEIPMELVGWIQDDIDVIGAELLEECELFLYPTTTYGDALVTVKDGQTVTIPVDQAFAITYYLTPAGYKNTTIRPSLMASSKSTLNAELENKTISMSDAVGQMDDNSGSDVLALTVSGLGGDADYPVLTVNDDAVRLSIRKKLTVLPNEQLTIEDDVQFNFYMHQVSSS